MAKKNSFFLSKSKFMDGLSCPKLLWYEYHKKREIPAHSPELIEIMKQGQVVGAYARRLFPSGVKVERDWKPEITHERSIKTLTQRRPLFEAGFVFGQTYALADILIPAGDNAWNLVEVKSSSSAKNEHYDDVAFQKYVFDGAGLNLEQCFIMYLNRDYEKVGQIEIDKLFKKDEITAEVIEQQPQIKKQVEEMLAIINGPEPEVKVGQRCRDCPLYEKCWAFMPEQHVFLFRGDKKIAFDLMKQGVLDFENIPAAFELNPQQKIQVEAHQNNKPYVNKAELKKFLSQLVYPLYFLDFETVASAIPIYDHCRPYEDIPVQFSLHILDAPNSKLRHSSYLAKGDSDPRPEILKRLKELLGDSGSIIAFYADYERKCLRYAVRNCPQFNRWFVTLKNRFVDLFIPFKNMWYYSPKQMGSASLKDILPALTDLSYENMEIGAGGLARFEYMRVTYSDRPEDKKDQAKVYAALEKYCELDTLAMVKIVEALKREVGD